MIRPEEWGDRRQRHSRRTSVAVKIQLMGPPQFELDGSQVKLSNRKATAVLVYLAVEGRCTRERLAQLLWEDCDDRRAAANLRRALQQIQKELPGFLVLDESELWLNPALMVNRDGPTAPFCEGLKVRGCSGFDSWLSGQREKSRDQQVAQLLAGAQNALNQGLTDEALQLARQVLVVDPLRERAHALCIEILRSQGDQGAAQRQWQACVEYFWSELQTVPNIGDCWGPALADSSGCRLYLLGKPRVLIGGELQKFPYQKALALLAFLAVEGEAIARDRLRVLLWPQLEGSQAAANLRHALHLLRHRLGEVVGSEGDLVWLDRTRFWLDIHQQQLSGGQPGGLFCEGLSLDDSPEFNAWLSQQRSVLSKRPETAARTANRGNIPAALNKLVGVENVLEQASELLLAGRLLTITGSAGVGKTQLALELMRRLQKEWPAGAWLVELGSLFDEERLCERMAAILGVREAPGTHLREQLCRELQPRRLLLLLDNCEHLVGAVADLASELLERCPELSLVATSRELLRVPGETVLNLEPLPVPPSEATEDEARDYAAVRLFDDRARATNPRFKLESGNLTAVSDICRRLDGIPLAIELAAVRSRALSAEQIAAGLNDRFRLLRGGPRTVPQRQQTLEAALSWSYELLSSEQSDIFVRLSVFAGSFNLEAAAAVCEPTDIVELLDHLASLIDRSMICSREQDGEFRYWMLETVRDFAFRELERRPELDRVRKLHFDHFLGVAQERPTGITGLGVLQVDHENFRLALEWGLWKRPQESLLLAGALGDYWFYKGYFSEGSAYLERALKRALSPQALLWSGRLHQALGRYGEAESEFRQSADLARQQGEMLLQAQALNALAQAGFSQGDYLGPRCHAEAALELWTAADHQRGLVDTLNILATAECCLGQSEKACRTLERSLRLSRANDYRWGECGALYVAGLNAIYQGDYGSAVKSLQASLELCRQLGNAPRTSACLGYLALASCFAGLDSADLYLEEAERLAEATGYQGVIAFVDYVFGVVYLQRGRKDEALPRLLASLQLLHHLRVRESIGLVLLCLADAFEEKEPAEKLLGASLGFLNDKLAAIPHYLQRQRSQGQPCSLEEAVELALKRFNA